MLHLRLCSSDQAASHATEVLLKLSDIYALSLQLTHHLALWYHQLQIQKYASDPLHHAQTNAC